jgi:hypothetical protein
MEGRRREATGEEGVNPGRLTRISKRSNPASRKVRGRGGRIPQRAGPERIFRYIAFASPGA